MSRVETLKTMLRLQGIAAAAPDEAQALIQEWLDELKQAAIEGAESADAFDDHMNGN